MASNVSFPFLIERPYTPSETWRIYPSFIITWMQTLGTVSNSESRPSGRLLPVGGGCRVATSRRGLFIPRRAPPGSTDCRLPLYADTCKTLRLFLELRQAYSASLGCSIIHSVHRLLPKLYGDAMSPSRQFALFLQDGHIRLPLLSLANVSRHVKHVRSRYFRRRASCSFARRNQLFTVCAFILSLRATSDARNPCCLNCMASLYDGLPLTRAQCRRHVSGGRFNSLPIMTHVAGFSWARASRIKSFSSRVNVVRRGIMLPFPARAQAAGAPVPRQAIPVPLPSWALYVRTSRPCSAVRDGRLR